MAIRFYCRQRQAELERLSRKAHNLQQAGKFFLGDLSQPRSGGTLLRTEWKQFAGVPCHFRMARVVFQYPQEGGGRAAMGNSPHTFRTILAWQAWYLSTVREAAAEAERAAGRIRPQSLWGWEAWFVSTLREAAAEAERATSRTLPEPCGRGRNS